jgi:CheY-like chemotaxis protein
LSISDYIILSSVGLDGIVLQTDSLDDCENTIVKENSPITTFQPFMIMSTQPTPPITPPCSPLTDYTLKPDPPEISIDCPPKQFPSRHKSRDSFSSCLSGGFRTLIVDDNPINLNILERTLKRHFSHLVSPNIAVATSGNSALSQLSPPAASPRDEFPPTISAAPPTPTQEFIKTPFDLILLDIDMPDISGVQVAEQIRNVHNDQNTAIVAVTTSTHPEQQRTYEMVGMDGVVGKPIDLDLLDRVVTRALISRRHHPRPRTSSVPPLSKEILAKQLQREYFERLAERQDRLSASSTDVSSSPSDGTAMSRRSSFPLSLGEFQLIQESASPDSDLCDISEQLAKACFLKIYESDEDSISDEHGICDV